MTPAQQKKAIKLIKDIVEANDRNEGSYDDHDYNMVLRLFLIEVGAIPDRRKKSSTKTAKAKP